MKKKIAVTAVVSLAIIYVALYPLYLGWMLNSPITSWKYQFFYTLLCPIDALKIWLGF